jgi:hypothetical protein
MAIKISVDYFHKWHHNKQKTLQGVSSKQTRRWKEKHPCGVVLLEYNAMPKCSRIIPLVHFEP